MSEQQIGCLARFRNQVIHAVLESAGDDLERLERLLSQTALVASLLDGLEKHVGLE